MNWIAIALGALLIAGCVSNTPVESRPTVGMSMILPNAAERMNVREKQVFLMPSPIEADLPVYPAAAPPSPTVSICAEIVVNEDGAVESAKQIESSPHCALLTSDASKHFGGAVLDAVRTWTFAAAAICHYERKQEECDGDGAKLQVVPVKLAYRFEFSNNRGAKSVSRTDLGRRH